MKLQKEILLWCGIVAVVIVCLFGPIMCCIALESNADDGIKTATIMCYSTIYELPVPECFPDNFIGLKRQVVWKSSYVTVLGFVIEGEVFCLALSNQVSCEESGVGLHMIKVNGQENLYWKYEDNVPVSCTKEEYLDAVKITGVSGGEEEKHQEEI